MCGRTSLAVDPSVLEARFGVTVPPDLPKRYNIAPGEDLATVRNDAPEAIETAEWGLLPEWADDPADGPAPINARSETVAEKSLFQDAFERRRCLVLADGFYEWKGSRGAKQPYRVQRPDGEPYAYAGLWETWTPPDGGEARVTCVILTTEANGVVSGIHDRMPAILEPDEEAAWLGGADAATHRSLLDPYPGSLLEAYPVSTAVNDPSNDSADLLAPVNVAEQSDLGDFGA